MVKHMTDGVRINDLGDAELEIHYKVIDPKIQGGEYSDSIVFSARVGRMKLASSRRSCVSQAVEWAMGYRTQVAELGAWDNAGNHY